MKFINAEHERNFSETLVRFPKAETDKEYRAACYILAAPMIFEKFENQLATFYSPVSWIVAWENYYTLADKDELDDAPPQPDYDLTSSMIQLGKLALNLWNGYKYFNLMDCLAVLDDAHYQLYKWGVDVRLGKE